MLIPIPTAKKQLFHFLVLIVAGVFQSLHTGAQILNVDRNIPADSSKRFFALLALSGSADKQKKDLVDISTSADITYQLPRSLVIVFKANTDLTTNGNDLIQNSGFLHLRYRDNDTRKLYPEIFTQLQWNGVLGMDERILAGANLRFMAVHKDDNDMFAGIGLMGEWETWNYKGVRGLDNPELLPLVVVKKIRINQYLKWAWKISDKTDFVIANFIQLPLDNLEKPRIASSAAVNFRLLKWLGLAINYDSMYDLDPVVPISKYYYSLRSTLNLVF